MHGFLQPTGAEHVLDPRMPSVDIYHKRTTSLCSRHGSDMTSGSTAIPPDPVMGSSGKSERFHNDILPTFDICCCKQIKQNEILKFAKICCDYPICESRNRGLTNSSRHTSNHTNGSRSGVLLREILFPEAEDDVDWKK